MSWHYWLPPGQEPSRSALEALEAYRERRMAGYQLPDAVIPLRYKLDAFLKERQVGKCTAEDF